MSQSASENPAFDAITSRQSIRAFTDQPVDTGQIEELLRVARWAPSGSNIQPWKLHVLTGDARDRLAAAPADGDSIMPSAFSAGIARA